MLNLMDFISLVLTSLYYFSVRVYYAILSIFLWMDMNIISNVTILH